MLRSMNTAHTPRPSRAKLPSGTGSILFDRASLEGLECQDSGWDEWDTCVAEQDLRDAVLDALRPGTKH